ncbi:unnamed protein product [Trichobilharzia regenti]|nr:unnamed protein product [Trichobilharzia regenti]
MTEIINELWAYIDRFLKTSRSAAKQLSPTLSRSVPLSSIIALPGPFSPAINMPVILCGDLNSLPESGVIEFLTKGSVSLTHSDFLNNGYKYMFKDWRLLEKWAIDGNSLRHHFTFDRAYQDSEGMCLTNFTYDFKGMIDYVLFTRQHFRLLGSLDQICEPWFQEKKILGCPHVHIPSDHFALLVELELIQGVPDSCFVLVLDSSSVRTHTPGFEPRTFWLQSELDHRPLSHWDPIQWPAHGL